jgi:hypothetical protein
VAVPVVQVQLVRLVGPALQRIGHGVAHGLAQRIKAGSPGGLVTVVDPGRQEMLALARDGAGGAVSAQVVLVLRVCGSDCMTVCCA